MQDDTDILVISAHRRRRTRPSWRVDAQGVTFKCSTHHGLLGSCAAIILLVGIHWHGVRCVYYV